MVSVGRRGAAASILSPPSPAGVGEPRAVSAEAAASGVGRGCES